MCYTRRKSEGGVSAARYFNISTSHVNSTSIMNICLNQHRMTLKINIELKYRPNRCTLSDIDLHSAKIHERNVILVTLEGYLVSFWNVRVKTNYIENRI